MKKFKSFEEYENWTEKFDDCSEYQMTPVMIDDGWKVAMDMFTECKSYKTAIRRFEKAFGDEFKDVKDCWAEGILESCENGYFFDKGHDRAYYGDNVDEYYEAIKNGNYGYGVEEVEEGLWYIFLNVSGAYAGRETA